MSETQQTDALSARLSNIAASLGTDATKAATEASEVLDAVPGQQQALLLLVSALRLLKETAAAREILEWMAEKLPNLASIHYELGLLLGRMGARPEAIKHLARAVELEPNHPAAWRALGNQHSLSGDAASAGEAYAEHAKQCVKELKLLEDATETANDDLVKAENMLRQSLEINPTDVSMMRMLADVYVRLSRAHLARDQLKHALELVPGFLAARADYATAFSLSMQWHNAIAQYDILIATAPRPAWFKTSKATGLAMLGEFDKAFALYDEARPDMANDPPFWLNYGHTLRTVGKRDEAIKAYKKCVEIEPGFGGAWYGLANLKTYRFSPEEVDLMRAQWRRDDIEPAQRSQLAFALGHALEELKTYPESFEFYRQANAIRRERVFYDANETTTQLKKAKAFFSSEFFKARQGTGCSAPDPIFIVGMVRAGSTLIEQILSSHSRVEGTMELPDVVDLVTDLKIKHPNVSYPEFLARLDGNALQALGERYLQTTRIQRKLDRPYFTDKAGVNFTHIGLLQLILPNAKIIDARRHPLSCCFSCFKQAFPASSVAHAYELTELGRYYHDYVELMAHWDKVLPGRVHRVIHEELIDNPDQEIRKLLEFCGLPFEESCVRFYENERSVRTSSSEQVRKPITKKAVEAWQHYEPWLGPVKAALGDVLTLYPAVPAFP